MPITMGEKIKIIADRRGITTTELASRIGTSRQNLTNKFSRDNFSEQDLIKIAEELDCEFIGSFRMRDTGEIL